MHDDTLVNKIASIERCVARAKAEYARDPDTFAQDFTRQDAAILNIQRACEAALDMGHHLGIDQTPDQEVEPVEIAEAHQNTHTIALDCRARTDIRVDQHDIPRIGAGQRPIGDDVERERQGEPRKRKDPATRLEDHGLVEGAQRHLGVEQLAERTRIEAQHRTFPRQVERHRDRVAADRVPVLAEIGLGDSQRLGKRGAYAVAEPGLQPHVEEDDREPGHHDRRQGRER